MELLRPLVGQRLHPRHVISVPHDVTIQLNSGCSTGEDLGPVPPFSVGLIVRVLVVDKLTVVVVQVAIQNLSFVLALFNLKGSLVLNGASDRGKDAE